MNSSDIPSRITKAFGVNGLKNTIPVDSSSTTDNNGVATFDKGFPPITMQPLSAGGIPPSGKDMNGVIYSVTLQQQWQNAGGAYPFNQAFSDLVGGYPRGALIPSSVGTGQWLNLNEANGTPPESPTGATTGWVPQNNYGVTNITMTTGSVVMTSLQAAKDQIILSGALTANLNLVFPAWIKGWKLVNNCTGNFSITCRTASGSGVAVPTGLTAYLYCDGVNISQDSNILGIPGRLINVQVFSSSGTYTPTKGTKTIVAEIQGGGGGGGGVGTRPSSGTMSIGASGGAGGYGKFMIGSLAGSYVVTVGQGGSPGAASSSSNTTTTGAAGGATSLGSIATATGGAGATFGVTSGGLTIVAGRSQGGSASGTGLIANVPGGNSRYGFTLTTFIGTCGSGGRSFFGDGGQEILSQFDNTSQPGNNGPSIGSGGSGAVSSGTGAGAAGGRGADGVVIIWEYA